MKFKLTICFVLVYVPCVVAQAQHGRPLKVLFVGNSFTYFYNLPQVVHAMAVSQQLTIETRQSTVGGSNLEQHWKEQKGTRTMRLLDSTSWDYVVFNNHSTSAIETPESIFEYGKKFAELTRSKGAKPVFMMTWAYESDPLMYAPIRDAYTKLGAETGASVVPGGVLFEEVRKLRPDLDMYFDDKHPSSNGTYMLGLTFLKFFIQKSIEKVPVRITTKDKDGEILYLIFMHDEDASFLKKLVNDLKF
jgi:hypothetical protein